ncbi:MAG: CheR family methyltransferase [Acidobacteriota bacterium]
MTVLEEVAARLADEIGLDPDVLGIRSIASAVAARAAALRLRGDEDYLRALPLPGEWDALVDEVVVPETWFFRDPSAFALLAEHARSREGVYRVLSVPCGSGEEAYSIAMCLADARVGAFEVDAFDVSQALVDRARRGVYGPRSVRGAELPAHHVTRRDGEIGVAAHVRSTVRFATGNLASPGFLQGAPLYDAIFCRNLLIYLHTAARARAIGHVTRLLAPQGIVFAGHAEALSVHDRRFRPFGPGEAFAFSLLLIAPGPAAVAAPIPIAASRRPPRRVEPERDAEPGSSLAKAVTLADRGLYADAMDLCERHVALHGPTAQALFLRGVLRQAARQEGAEDAFRQALLLDPHHGPSLRHLALLADARGDHARARGYRRRAATLRSRA